MKLERMPLQVISTSSFAGGIGYFMGSNNMGGSIFIVFGMFFSLLIVDAMVCVINNKIFEQDKS